ncbi:AMP-binding protein, partial [Mycobacterium simiae]
MEWVAELRQSLRAQLPEYMVPAAIMIVDDLPLTVNGKLDRRALPAPEFLSGATYRAPRDHHEHVLAALFGEVLGVVRVGIDDSFFELGGHSLSATRLVMRARTELDIEIPVRALFHTPTVAGLAEWITTHAHTRTQAALTPRPRPARIPLSFAQSRLWFLHKYEGPSATYNIAIAARLTGPLNTTALRAAIGDVIDRHESLRTVFTETDTIAYQQILPAHTIEVPVTVTEVAADHELSAAIAHAARYHFELSTHIPIRADLLRVSDTEHVLVLVVHHIAADGASLVPLAHDLATAYTARRAGQQPSWPPLPVQYADYTLWQHDILGSDDDPNSVISQQVAYWRNELAGAPEQITLPTDHPRPAQQSFRGKTATFTINPQLRQRIHQLAHDSGTTISMVLQGALTVLLRKLGAGADLTIGGPIAGRTDQALTNLIGFFVNTWVLRVDTSGNPAFTNLLEQIRTKALAAYDNQDAPFERLVELLNPTRSTAHHPLFQVAFAFQNNPLPTIDLPELGIEFLPAPTGTARFDLLINLLELPPRHGQPPPITGSIEYATDLFNHNTITTFTTYYLRILHTITTNPHQHIDLIDLLTPAERHHILTQGNNTTTITALPNTTVTQLFATQLTRTPHAPALTHTDTTLTYRQLDDAANHLAHQLAAHGAGPGQVIALLLERSAQAIIAILAI